MNAPLSLGGPPADPGVAPPSQEPQAAILGASLVAQIEHGLATSARSRQRDIGASEAGFACARRVCYRLHDTPKTNYRDPNRLLLGIGMHSALGDIFERLGDRYLVEHQVTYMGIRGTLDIYDRGTATIIDWKTTSKARLASYAKQGPPKPYIVQLNLYAAGLMQQGYLVSRIALAFIPYDGALSGLWVWLGRPDIQIASDAVARLKDLRVIQPYEAPATPDRLCPYCDHYLPTSTDLSIGCPGTK